MIRGVVNARYEAVVRLRVRGPGGVESDVEAIVDSGFTSSLTLPMTVVTAVCRVLNLSLSGCEPAGSVTRTSLHAGELRGGEVA